MLLTLALVLVLVLGAAAYEYIHFNGEIKTFAAKGLSKHRPPPTVAGQNILIIGSDSRAGADGSLGGAGDAVGRSDTTLLVHIYQGGRRAVAVSIPRDALVDIPPCLLPDGTWSAPQHHVMFNAAFSVGQTPQGNPACTVNTVENLTHMRVDHTVVTDFAGFAAMTQIVGGVPVCLPKDVYQIDLDPNRATRLAGSSWQTIQGQMIFHKGVQEVSGAKALDFVRLRHGLGDGSDIGRMHRQQAFLGAVITKVRAQGLTPTHILPLAEAATKYMTVDPALGDAQKLLSFALSLRNMSLKDIVFVTTPWRYDGYRVDLVHPDVDRLWAALKADQPVGSMTDAAGARAGALHAGKKQQPTVAQRLRTVTTPVTVLNGAGVSGLAARTSDILRAAKVTIAQVGNAAGQTATVVRYGRGQQAQAEALASAFVGARVEPGTTPGLTLVLGARHHMRSLHAVPGQTVVKVPDSVTKDARTASSNVCSGVS